MDGRGTFSHLVSSIGDASGARAGGYFYDVIGRDAADLASAVTALRAISTMRADFVQADARGQQVRGVLTLKRPGKIRFQYEKGVPMGGDLPAAAQGKAPSFMVWAIKDPQSGNLDRIQIVKGWVDAGGAEHEKIYDVVWSGERVIGADGKLPFTEDETELARSLGKRIALLALKLKD